MDRYTGADTDASICGGGTCVYAIQVQTGCVVYGVDIALLAACVYVLWGNGRECVQGSHVAVVLVCVCQAKSISVVSAERRVDYSTICTFLYGVSMGGSVLYTKYNDHCIEPIFTLCGGCIVVFCY